MNTVYQALTEIIKELPGIGKGGTGPKDQGGYKYRGIEQITSHVSVLLAKHGVVVIPSATLISDGPAPGMKESWTRVILQVDWTIVGPDGSTMPARTIGIGHDSGDKGSNKAMSQAYKYLWLDLLCIADTKDDSDGADYSTGVRAEPVPVPDTEGVRLARRLREPMSAASKDRLKEIAANYGFKLIAADLDEHPEFANEVRLILDGVPA